MNKQLLTLAGVVIIFGTALVILISTRDGTTSESQEGLIKIKGYSYIQPGAITCQAITPECGVCYGEVINKECYVTKAQFNEFKRAYPNLEAE